MSGKLQRVKQMDAASYEEQLQQVSRQQHQHACQVAQQACAAQY
jgi:hypothetical protein